MVNYAWKSIATFLRIYKNSLGGIKNSQYSKDPISATIREELNILYKEQYDEPATEDITDKDIEKAMINFPGDSTIPGFPSIDAFLSLLNPLLKRLQNPAYEANNKIHEIMESEALAIIDETLSKKYPEFNTRFKDLIKKILDKVNIVSFSIVEIWRAILIHYWTVNYFIFLLMTSTILLETSIKWYLYFHIVSRNSKIKKS